MPLQCLIDGPKNRSAAIFRSSRRYSWRYPARQNRKILPPPPQSLQSLPLIVEPSPISLGVLRPGQSRHVPVTIRNLTNQRVAVDRMDISCPCVCVTPTRFALQGGESVRLDVRYDLVKTSGFRGQLAVDFSGATQDGLVQFHATIELFVPGRDINDLRSTDKPITRLNDQGHARHSYKVIPRYTEDNDL